MYWEFGFSRCELLQIEWINSKVLLCSTGNYVQYPVINHNVKNMKKNVYRCITESICCTVKFSVQQKLTQYCKLTIHKQNKFFVKKHVLMSSLLLWSTKAQSHGRDKGALRNCVRHGSGSSHREEKMQQILTSFSYWLRAIPKIFTSTRLVQTLLFDTEMHA